MYTITRPILQVWRWSEPGDQEPKEFYDAETFRQFVEEERLPTELQALLPRDEAKAVEKPAEEQLRKRMYGRVCVGGIWVI